MTDSPSQNRSDRSARWYASLIENLPVGLYRATLEGRLVFCNKAFAQLFGYDSNKDLIGHPVTRLYRDERDRRALVQAISGTGYVKDLPLGLIRRDGTPLWCAATAKAVFDENGTVVLIDGAVREIGGQEQEEKMAATLDDVLSKISDFILIIDFQGEVLGVNKAFAEFFGQGYNLRPDPQVKAPRSCQIPSAYRGERTS